jgi:uncharacterized membrane protein
MEIPKILLTTLRCVKRILGKTKIKRLISIVSIYLDPISNELQNIFNAFLDTFIKCVLLVSRISTDIVFTFKALFTRDEEFLKNSFKKLNEKHRNVRIGFRLLLLKLFHTVTSSQYYSNLKINKTLLFLFAFLSLRFTCIILLKNSNILGSVYFTSKNPRETIKKSTLKNRRSSVIASLPYFMTVWITIRPFQGVLKRMESISLLAPLLVPSNALKVNSGIPSIVPSIILKTPMKNFNLPWNAYELEITSRILFKFLYSVFGFFYKERQAFVIALLYYYFIYRDYRDLKFGNVEYFIKFHFMHSMLLVIALTPLNYILVILMNSQLGGKSMRVFWELLGYNAIIINFSIIFYCMFSASMGNYCKIPVITKSAELHLGTNAKNL